VSCGGDVLYRPPIVRETLFVHFCCPFVGVLTYSLLSRTKRSALERNDVCKIQRPIKLSALFSPSCLPSILPSFLLVIRERFWPKVFTAGMEIEVQHKYAWKVLSFSVFHFKLLLLSEQINKQITFTFAARAKSRK